MYRVLSRALRPDALTLSATSLWPQPWSGHWRWPLSTHCDRGRVDGEDFVLIFTPTSGWFRRTFRHVSSQDIKASHKC